MCRIHTVTSPIIVDRAVDGKFNCPIDCCTRTFGWRDNLQSHLKVPHLEQDNSAPDQLPDDNDDNVQQALSIGMLIHLPIKQTTKQLRDSSFVVMNIMGVFGTKSGPTFDIL